jgi:RNA polymerase sigma factor (TIGR02999 family)
LIGDSDKVTSSDSADDSRIAALLEGWRQRDPAARDQLVAVVYDELRRLAHHYMKNERDGHALQTTALINEMYLRLVGLDRMQLRDRSHFIAMAATLMRQVLVDYARRAAREKRGGGVSVTSLDGHDVAAGGGAFEVVALDEALTRLAVLDSQQARVVELRFFGGLSVEETADALSVSAATVKREWAMAKAWLHQQLTA